MSWRFDPFSTATYSAVLFTPVNRVHAPGGRYDGAGGVSRAEG